EFKAEIIDGVGGGMYVEFPGDVEKLFGVKGRVPINASFDGVPYRGSLTNMGAGCHTVGVLKQIRESLGKGAGDKIKVVVELDVEERKIELAEDAAKELKKHAAAKAAFEKLSYTNQREFHMWIEAAKRPETRHNRIVQMVEKLESGKKTPSD